jgi:hypothetical protein
MRRLRIFVFLFMNIASYGYIAKGQELPIGKSSPVNFGIRLGPSLNFFNHGDLKAGQIASDYQWGGSIGMLLDYKVSDFIHMRLEPFYEFQRVKNRYSDDLNSVEILFKNNNLGLDLFPLVLRTGGRFQPEIAIGGFAKYVLSSRTKTVVNQQLVDNLHWQTEPIQFGFALGGGFYLGEKLLEIRWYNPLTSFVVPDTLKNKINQFQFIIAW